MVAVSSTFSNVSVAFGSVTVPDVLIVTVPDPDIKLVAVFPDNVLLVKVSVPAKEASVPVTVGNVKVAAPDTKLTAMLPVRVLLVNVSVVAGSTIVPLASGHVNVRVVPVVILAASKAMIFVASPLSTIVNPSS